MQELCQNYCKQLEHSYWFIKSGPSTMSEGVFHHMRQLLMSENQYGYFSAGGQLIAGRFLNLNKIINYSHLQRWHLRGILMNKEICGLREISSISAHCPASVAPQGTKTNIKVHRSIYMHHNSIIMSLNV